MEMLNHAVGLRVICSGARSFGSEEGHERIPQLGLKLATTVSDDSGWDTKTRDPTSEEGLGHSFCRDTSEGNGFWPPCETVNTGQQISESSRWWKWSNKIDVDDIKTSIRVWEG